MFLIERILCPVDFSVPSREGLRYGAFFSARYHARVYVLHVLDPGHGRGPVEDPADGPARERAERFVAEAVAGFPVEVEIRKGKPFVEIIRFARERDVDLIVLCAHGQGGGSFSWIGSTAERVVRKSPCPVLTVRPLRMDGHSAGGDG